jgi:hypothetical protein
MSKRVLLAVILALLAVVPCRAKEKPSGHWVVVTAPAFRAVIEPLCEHRKAQGLRVTVVQTTDVLSAPEILAGQADKLRRHVNQLGRASEGTTYVLLVGAVGGALSDAEKKVVPALRGTVSRMKGQPSDNGYGNPGDDLVPAVAVGRFPARTAQEAEQMVRKTLAFERDDRPGQWRRRATVLAGIPAYNPFVDKLVETLAMARFERLDPSWQGRAIYHNPQSRFCVPDDALHDRALAYVQEGQAVVLYLGHSSPRGLYAREARFLDRDDWAKLKITRGAGVFATFGCNGCQLAGWGGEGYGVAAFRNPDGPVAVLGSHGICFAAMVQLAAEGAMASLLGARPPERLAEAWLALEKGLASGKIDDLSYKLLDSVDGDAKIPQATQRREHLEMFVLLGDPALRLPVLPADVRLETDGELAAGKTLTVKGEVPARLAGAAVRVTVERSLTSEPADLQPLPKEPAEQARVMLANHERANRFVLAAKEVKARDGRFEAALELPPKLPWPRLILRAYAATELQEGQGVLSLPVKRGQPPR